MTREDIRPIFPQRSGLVSASCLIAGGDLLEPRCGFYKRAARYVEVKGQIERTAKSDSAIRTLKFSADQQTDGSIMKKSIMKKVRVVSTIDYYLVN